MSVGRVCFFSGDISRTGGTERVATVIASALAERGFDVHILSMGHGDVSGFPLHPAVKLSSLHMEGRSANFSDIAKWRALRRFVREQQIDVLVDVDVVLSWYSLIATWRLPVSVISWEHFHYFNNVGDSGQRLRRFIARRMAVRRGHALVTLTQRDREQYHAQLDCRRPVIAIPNPITIRHARQAALEAPVVLAAGRLVDHKGFDHLLQAWAIAVEGMPGWHLRIVGSGPNHVSLLEQARRLGVTGSVDFEMHSSDMPAHYEAASLYAMSSRFEGLPLVLIEAKSFGLPIVSFDCACGPSDIVRDGVDGTLVAPGDVPALAAALRGLMADSAKRVAYGKAARSDDRFELDRVVDAWVKLLDGETPQ